jgi:hypothetical protein
MGEAQKGGSLRNILTAIQAKYPAKDQDFDAISGRLESLFDGWTEHWSEPIPSGGYDEKSVRHYVLEKPGPSGREVKISRDVSISDRRHSGSLLNYEKVAARMADDSAYRRHRTAIPYRDYLSGDESGLIKGGWAFMAAIMALIGFAGAGSEMMAQHLALQVMVFGTILVGLPFISRSLGHAFSGRIEDLEWGKDNGYVTSLGKALEGLRAIGERLAGLRKVARGAFYAVSALTALAVFAGARLLGGEHEVALMFLRWGGVGMSLLLWGLLIGLKNSHFFAMAAREKLRLNGVQRPGGI